MAGFAASDANFTFSNSSVSGMSGREGEISAAVIFPEGDRGASSTGVGIDS